MTRLLLLETGAVGTLITIIACVLCIAIGVLVGVLINKKATMNKIGDAKEAADKIINEATVEAKSLKKEAILEAKEE
ncbi:MAG: Rnase Y domain-containing protein, partial [Clostridia bacterium]